MKRLRLDKVLPRRRRHRQRGVTMLLAMVVLASLILGGSIGAWMRVINTRTSGTMVLTARSSACVDAGLNAARQTLLVSGTPVMPANLTLLNNVTTASLGYPGHWSTILSLTWDPVNLINKPYLQGTVVPPLGGPFPTQSLTFQVTLSDNQTEFPLWSGAQAVGSPTSDHDGLFILTVTCFSDSTLSTELYSEQRYLRHPGTTYPGGPGAPTDAKGGSTAAPP